jgi:hypothetical protein
MGGIETYSVTSVNLAESLTESDVTEIIGRTEIDATQITTGTINANVLNIGEIATEVAKVGNLTVDKLNTTPGETKAGTIKIEGNEISVFNKNKKSAVLTISGSNGKSELIDAETTDCEYVYNALPLRYLSINNGSGSGSGSYHTQLNPSEITIPN